MTTIKVVVCDREGCEAVLELPASARPGTSTVRVLERAGWVRERYSRAQVDLCPAHKNGARA